jgi:hypothetical protein
MTRQMIVGSDEEAERRMADAYRRQPDDAEPELVDLKAWEPRRPASSAPSAPRSTGRS